MKRKIMATVLLVVMSFSLTGCFAGWGNRKANKGSYITDDNGNYVIQKQSGGQIMDCWIIKDTFVNEISNSDGFTFIDANGNGVTIQGDAEAIRINDARDFDNYIEYHRSKDLISYEEFYKAHKANK